MQVVLEKKLTLFIDDPLKMPGLEKNEDWVKFGYGYYVGAPWTVGQLKGMTHPHTQPLTLYLFALKVLAEQITGAWYSPRLSV